MNLGVVLDSQLSTSQQVTAVCCSRFYQLRQLKSVNSSLTREALHSLIQAFVHCRIDYCNSTLAGVAKVYLQKLQSVRNMAARMACHGVALPYFSDRCVPGTAISSRQHRRSAATGTLLVSRARTATGQRSFAVSGPATWNRLPPALRSPDLSESTFKRHRPRRLHDSGAGYKYPDLLTYFQRQKCSRGSLNQICCQHTFCL